MIGLDTGAIPKNLRLKPQAIGHSSNCHAIRRSAQLECLSAPTPSIANVIHLRNGPIAPARKRDRRETHGCRDPKTTGATKTTMPTDTQCYSAPCRYRARPELAISKTRMKPGENAFNSGRHSDAARHLQRIHAPPEHSSFASPPRPLYRFAHSFAS
jgi:hypothetical protein